MRASVCVCVCVCVSEDASVCVLTDMCSPQRLMTVLVNGDRLMNGRPAHVLSVCHQLAGV